MERICVFTTPLQSKSEPIKQLRQLKHLSVVEVDLEEERDLKPPRGVWEKAREIWKGELISLLKDSPSTDRKFLRWKVVRSYRNPHGAGRGYDVVETEELEVLPETSL